MGPASSSISPLEQFLITGPVEGSSKNSDVTTIDLKDICALRQRSIRKFVRTLDDIVARYEGDGDEEADDVIDLEHLEVIEDRGFILNRFSNQSAPSGSSSCSSAKGKCRADEESIFEILDPIASDGDDEWVEDEPPDEDGDDAHNEDQDDDSHHSDSSSIIPASSSSSFKIPFEDINSTRKKTLYPNSSYSSSILSEPSAIKPLTQLPATYHDDHTITNALFERLKKRIQQRSSDINKHRLYKQSIYQHDQGEKKDTPSFSSPSSSMIASSSLSSALTPMEYMISPDLQRLLCPNLSTEHALQGNSRLTSPQVPTPQTPGTVRMSRIQEPSSSCISYVNRQDTAIRKTRRYAKRSLESSSSMLGTPSHEPNSSKISSSSTTTVNGNFNRPILVPDDESNLTSTMRLSSTEAFKPVFLFKNCNQITTCSRDRVRQNKKIKLNHPVRSDLSSPTSSPSSGNRLDSIVHHHPHHEDVQSSRESSEDPMYLPPPNRSKKSKSKS